MGQWGHRGHEKQGMALTCEGAGRLAAEKACLFFSSHHLSLFLSSVSSLSLSPLFLD